MARFYELRGADSSGKSVTLIDLDKVMVVRMDTAVGHSYPSVHVRFVDGHEASDIVPPASAEHFLDAFRAHLGALPLP
jgi:hypothetical protein